jgi:hypothetical protein
MTSGLSAVAVASLAKTGKLNTSYLLILPLHNIISIFYTEEEAKMYITLADFLSLCMFIIALIVLIFDLNDRNKRK